MFKWYGFIGILLILLTELNFIFKIEPFASWYFPIIWLGYILTIDSIIYKLKNQSPISNQRLKFLFILILSIPFWYIFEVFNIFVANWYYNAQFTSLIRLICSMFIFTAIYETYILIKNIHLFDKLKLKRKHKITKTFLYTTIGLGVIALILPTIFPKQTFPLIWISLFLILDPINYINNQPSIIKHLKDKKLATPLSLMLAGLICGFLWEFWNYWAIPKWFYTFNYFYFLKIFEMPILGYLGYMPFALELYAMYWFVRSLFSHKKGY